jgi:hypothetical protein
MTEFRRSCLSLAANFFTDGGIETTLSFLKGSSSDFAALTR